MLTDTDIYFFWNRYPERSHLAIAFGINGKVIVDMATYVDFYDLMVSSDRMLPLNEDCSLVLFIKDGIEVETLKTSSFLGSLLCSNPDIIEIFRPPNPEQYARNSAVCSGWLYDVDGNFSLPYEGWDTEIIDGMYNSDREHTALEHYTGD